jgi:uncharacterized protein
VKNKNYFFVIAIIVFFLACYHFWPAVQSDNIKSVKIAGQDIKVELALTDKEKEQGLSGRAMLAPDQGMLFVFSKSDKYYFWMKEMKFPIDMIWVGEDMKVIYIEKNTEPASYPKTFGPDVNAKYVLEVVSGFSDKNNLKVGDEALFSY